MTKFKVGDKVRILDVDSIMYGRRYWRNGDITEVEEVDGYGEPHLKRTLPRYYLNDDMTLVVVKDEFHAIELVEDSGDKHHDLAEEIADLKRRVSELEAQKDGEVFIEIDTKELSGKIFPKKSPNELRKEAIEKAKEFIAEVTRKAKRNYIHTDGNYTYINKLTRPEIIVNEEKRTVVVLAKGIDSGILWEKGIAKCDPSDVFNADIGKAIALGRAYGLDVSEFEQAPQPDEVVVGHGFQSEMGTVGKVRELIDRKVLGGLYGKAFLHSEGNGWLGAKQVRILADSEAKY